MAAPCYRLARSTKRRVMAVIDRSPPQQQSWVQLRLRPFDPLAVGGRHNVAAYKSAAETDEDYGAI